MIEEWTTSLFSLNITKNVITIKIPNECLGELIVINFKKSRKTDNRNYPFGTVEIDYNFSDRSSVYITTNKVQLKKVKSSNIYPYRLNTRKPFTIYVANVTKGYLNIK